MKIVDSLFTIQDEQYIGEEPFSVMARVALQLGRESISNSITAISELVKNTYDADAEKVTIRFFGLKTNNPILIIEDNGNGMTYRNLQSQWMVIGTANKLHSEKSIQKKRVLTGEKGLGRLGLDRLCEKTIVHSFTEKEQRGTKLVIEWDRYEELDEKLEKIKHRFFNIPKIFVDPVTQMTREVNKGTQLILVGLKDIWTPEALLELKKELTLLISPFAGINDFVIEIDSGLNLKQVDGKIGSEYMLQAAEWKLVSRIDEKGNSTHKLISEQHHRIIETPPSTWKETFPKSMSELPECGPLELQIYFYPRRKVNLEEISFTRTQIEDFLNTNQGIRIYRDNFRVKPYGEPDGTGDWLRLSFRRQQSPQGVAQEPLGGWRVGYNQIVGAVFISREKNPHLIDQTNRENLVEGQSFFDLKAFAEKAIQFFELHRQKFEMEHKEISDYEKARENAKKTSEESTDALEIVRGVADIIQKQVEDGKKPDANTVQVLDDALHQLEDRSKKAQRAQRQLTKVAEEQQKKLQRQKDTLGNLASLGILAKSFGHETLGATNLVLSNALDLQSDIQDGLFMVAPDMRAQIDEELEIIVYEADKIETFAKFTLQNVRRDKRSHQKVFLNKIMQRVFISFKKYLDEKNIDIFGLEELPQSISPILAFEIDWESIFINLLTNAVWAMEDKDAGQKRLQISLYEKDGKLMITFADSGIGIESGMDNQIYLPTISTKRNTKGEITGTGMGLAIVKDFVESHPGGSISVKSPGSLGGAEFLIEVSIPDLVGRGYKTDD